MSQDRELANTKARNLTAMQATKQRPEMSPQSSTSEPGQQAVQQSLECRLAAGRAATVDEVGLAPDDMPEAGRQICCHQCSMSVY